MIGTKNGRISCGKDVFGFGANMLNQPHDIKECHLPDEGYLAVSIDYSSAENRIVAYISPDANMIEAFENGEDLHKKTAGIIFDKAPEEVSTEDDSCSFGTGEHSERFWGKKANHALNYDMGPGQFSKKYEIPMREAKIIIAKYFQGYPGVKRYHAWVAKAVRKNRILYNLFGKPRMFLGPINDDLLRDAYAYIPQSTVSEAVRRYAIQYIMDNQDRFYPVELLNFIYDSIEFQIPITLGWKKIAGLLLDIKENMETKLSWQGREFFLPAEISIGLSFGKRLMKDIPKEVGTLKEMSESLEKAFEEISK